MRLFHFIVGLLSNQLFSGGLLLMASGALMALCRSVPMKLWRFTQRRFIVTLDISNDDPSFFWISSWLAQQPYSKRARNLTVSSKRNHYGEVSTPQPVGSGESGHDDPKKPTVQPYEGETPADPSHPPADDPEGGQPTGTGGNPEGGGR